ncbi:MAG: nicotinate-nucleotide--dimethylbenzimidazole phosphoribosyltransferase [Planctomycetota bacterium]
MKRIEETLRAIRPPEPPGPAACARPPVPAEGLGALGRLAETLRTIYHSRASAGGPRAAGTPLRKLLLVAAADHGVSARGVSRYPQATTAELVGDVLGGRSAIARLAPGLRVRAVVTDFGMKGEAPGGSSGWAEFERSRVASGTEDVTERPAMSRETALEAVHAGIAALDRSCEGWDVDLVGIGDLGLGSTISACAIAAALTGRPVDSLCRSSSEPDAARVELVRRTVERASPDPDDAVAVLGEYGGLEIGALAGVCLAAGARRIPVLLDGAVSTAAACLAVRLAPAVRGYLVASHEAAMKAHGALLEQLGLEPLLRLRLDLGEGTGAVLAMSLVEAAWTLVRGA